MKAVKGGHAVRGEVRAGRREGRTFEPDAAVDDHSFPPAALMAKLAGGAHTQPRVPGPECGGWQRAEGGGGCPLGERHLVRVGVRVRGRGRVRVRVRVRIRSGHSAGP